MNFVFTNLVVLSLCMCIAPCFVLNTLAQDYHRNTLEVVVGSNAIIKGCKSNARNLLDKCPQPKSIISLPPLPSPVQQLLKFTDIKLAVIYPVIQKFKSLITSDPFNITQSWVGSNICSYKGFFCDNPPYNKSASVVASVDFNGFQLSAPTIQGFIDQLPDLALFHANSNFFSGIIPSSISKLPYLYEFDISNNRFSGPFPNAVLGMSNLTFLDIRFNFFTGSVPPQIFSQYLDVLFINNNEFTAIPSADGDIGHILYLSLANNKFSGPLPINILKSLSSLTEVLFFNNQLTGCLPYEIGYLKDVTIFDLGQNQLTGTVPFSLSCLQKVEQLNLADNLLFGKVPEVICQIASLTNLSLSGNYFTNVGPWCMFLIQKGVLDLRNNCVPYLPFQRPLMECAKFYSRPRFCPRMWSHNIIPCELPYSHDSPNTLIPEMAPSP